MMTEQNAARAFGWAVSDYIAAHGCIPPYFNDELMKRCKDYADDRRYRPMALAGCGNGHCKTTVIMYGHNKLEAYYDNDGNVTIRDYQTDNVLISL